MKLRGPYQRHWQKPGRAGRSSKGWCLKTIGIILVMPCSLWFLGCSSPPEPTPEPSKEEIRSDADRFFKKLEKEEETKEPIQP